MTFIRRSGPYTIVKEIEYSKPKYTVYSVAAEPVYTTKREKIGEKLNYWTLKKLLF